MATATTIHWGILGCGNVTEVKSGPAFNKVPGSRLAAVMRRDLAAAEDYAHRHGVPKFYGDADALIHDPEVDAVYIATPPSTHAALALKVAAAGKPCYVEKPMARHTEECDTMVDAFTEAGQPLYVAYYRRALPHFQRIKEIIDTRAFGSLQQIEYTYTSSAQRGTGPFKDWRFDPNISGGGLFWDLGSHALDLFDYWGGPLSNVSGQMKNLSGRGEVEELVGMTAECANGAQLVANWNFISCEAVDSVTLRFEDAWVHGSVFGPQDIRIHRFGTDAYTEPFELPENIQLPLITNIVASIRGEQEALSTGESGRRTNLVIDTVAKP